jgi:hypothetical protein
VALALALATLGNRADPCERICLSRRRIDTTTTTTTQLEHVDLEHDLTFDMFTDPEIAGIVRQLLQNKRECIRREDYRGAKEASPQYVCVCVWGGGGGEGGLPCRYDESNIDSACMYECNAVRCAQ